jgi:hypothetical protein
VIGFLKICLNVTPKPLTLSIGFGLTAPPPDGLPIDRSFQTDVPPPTPAKPAWPPARRDTGIASDAS